MAENENTAIVRRWFEEVWNQGNLDTIDELLDPECVAYDLGGPGASTRGPTAFRAAAEQLQTAFGEKHFVIDDIFGVDDRVAVRLTATLKHTGPLGALQPTGNTVKVPIMCMVRLKDGRLVEGYNQWDVASCLRAANAPVHQATLF
jgi:predicted ester cyclase